VTDIDGQVVSMTQTEASADPSPPRANSPQLIALPPRLYVPLPDGAAEHVAIKTRVTRGQPLLATAAEKSVMSLAPADGEIVAACDVRLLNGKTARALEIAVDGPGEATQPATTQAPKELEEAIDRIRACGVWVDRHTSPDLLAQLHALRDNPAHTVVCDLLDVDGGSSLNARIARDSGAAIVAGVAALATAVGAGRAWIATPARLADRMSVFVRKAGLSVRIKVAGLVNDYPQANPTLLLYALLGRRLRPEHLPPEIGVMLIDGPAAIAAGRALEANEPMLSVPIEIRDSIRSRSHVATAAMGTPLQHVLHALDLTDQYTLRAGAALRDVRIESGAIIAGTELSVDAGSLSPPINPDPCIRCGWCVEACPVRIHPAGLLEAAQDNDPALAEWYGLPACIECGICSYVCPSRLPLLGAIRQMRRHFATDEHR
jgi:electron transport complex protein RnfC